jgi:transcriptional regulator with XRE-family HTH domain
MIGNLIRQRRIELGMTQEELAHKLGYKSKSTINKIEIGVNGISQSKIKDFAAALDCSPFLFIEGVEHDPVPSDAVMKYAKAISELSPELQDNVMKYIDFLKRE